jgi:ABC-type sugar transport system substrate-binding protein
MKRFTITLLPALLLALTLAAPAFAQKEKSEAEASKGLLKFPVWVEDGEGRLWSEGKRQTVKVRVEAQDVEKQLNRVNHTSQINLKKQ